MGPVSRLFRAPRHRRAEHGQALAVIAALLAGLVMIPVAVQLLSTGQAPVATGSSYQQLALQAARAGVSDYLSWAESYDNKYYSSNYNSYSIYCSSGAFTKCSSNLSPAGGTSGRDVDNPAFATTWNDSHWVTVGSGNSLGNAAYQYLVDSSSVANEHCPSAYPVYVVGRAGTGTHLVYQQLQVTVQDNPGAPTVCPAPPPASGSCTTSVYSINVPPGATYASLVLYGGAGGAASGGGTGGGGYGAKVTSYVAVSGGQMTIIAGNAGGDGDYKFLGLFGHGGQGGCGVSYLAGGNGGGAAVDLLTGLGGGGGAASAVCWGIAGSSSSHDGCEYSTNEPPICTTPLPYPQTGSNACLMAVAGGGGGQGGENTVANGGYGVGGYQSANDWTAAGNSGHPSCILFCQGGLVFGTPGTGGAAGATSGSSSLSAGASGDGTGISIGAGTGGGGGGGACGGGYGAACASGTAGGGGGGGSGGILSLIVGTGGGGGVGASTAMSPPGGCSDTTTHVASYPVTGGSGYDGLVSYTFYPASPCAGGGLLGAWALLVRQQNVNAAYPTSFHN